ncbi:MAG: tetratricopeptide repeat protein [Nitrospirae bacterium]|nr:tetratricopeptide repeat protein [Nitrospirota bacterium]
MSKHRFNHKKEHPVVSPDSAVQTPTPLLKRPLVHMLMVAVLGILVYSNTLHAPFAFDDEIYIVSNPLIRDFGYFTGSIPIDKVSCDPDVKNNFITRPVTYLTLALNYSIHNLNTTGYHIFNIVIHISNGILVYILMSLLLQTPFLKHENIGTRSRLPLLAALLFICHPIQTQAVTYLVQRAASLATFFCLAAFVFYMLSRLSESSGKRFGYYSATVLFAAIAMMTKEISFTIPVVMALYEFLFHEGRAKDRIVRLLPILATMILVPASVLSIDADHSITLNAINRSIDLVNFSNMSRSDYFYTQLTVIVNYIRLLFFPFGQNLDYDYPVYRSLLNPHVFLSSAFLLAICGVAVYFLRLSQKVANPERGWQRLFFAGTAWFFITLSVESSFIPIDDMIFEHRVYLPSIGFFMAAIALLEPATAKLAIKRPSFESFARYAVIAIIAILSILAFSRNNVWGSRIGLLEDIVAKSSEKARPHSNLGLEYWKQGRNLEAIAEFEKTVRLDTITNDQWHGNQLINLAILYMTTDRWNDAEESFKKALAINPGSSIGHNSLGYLYFLKERLKEAEIEFNIALGIDKSYIKARNNLGMLLEKTGRNEEALQNYAHVLQQSPKDEFAIERIRALKPDSERIRRIQ